MSIALYFCPQNCGKIRISRKLQSLYFQQICVGKFLFSCFKFSVNSLTQPPNQKNVCEWERKSKRDRQRENLNKIYIRHQSTAKTIRCCNYQIRFIRSLDVHRYLLFFEVERWNQTQKTPKSHSKPCNSTELKLVSILELVQQNDTIYKYTNTDNIIFGHITLYAHLKTEKELIRLVKINVNFFLRIMMVISHLSTLEFSVRFKVNRTNMLKTNSY